jgi:hypothetical protein
MKKLVILTGSILLVPLIMFATTSAFAQLNTSENKATTCKFTEHFPPYGLFQFTLNQMDPNSSELDYDFGGGNAGTFIPQGKYQYYGQTYLKYQSSLGPHDLSFLVPYPILTSQNIYMLYCSYDSARGECGSYGNPFIGGIVPGSCK